MKYCAHCGQVMPDSAPVCGRCGYGATENGATPPPAPQYDAAADRAVLDQVRVGLRHERTAWKVGGIINCIYTGLFLLFTVGFFLLSEEFSHYSDDRFVLQAYAVAYVLMAFIGYLPCAIIGFVMASKCSRYLNNFSGDPGAAVQRCGSVGFIVLGALFNTIAMIFVIINFVRYKSNREALARAVQQEKQFALPGYFDTEYADR